jgi:peptidoglycan/LPS O-acetylase OafA/YrhL
MFRMDPFVPGQKVAPNADIGKVLGTLFGYLGWGIAAIACFALAGCAVMAWSQHRQGQSNEGVAKAGWVVGGVMVVGMVVGVVGTISGT